MALRRDAARKVNTVDNCWVWILSVHRRVKPTGSAETVRPFQPDLLAIGRENALRLKLDRAPHNMKPGLTLKELEIGGLVQMSIHIWANKEKQFVSPLARICEVVGVRSGITCDRRVTVSTETGPNTTQSMLRISKSATTDSLS
ncbi:hypothetical protein B0H17DRAFT_1141302 [Mycena rosella]|uniref:Uncharacterized protein n=1 Tax=Mycena rosella TaxID=1033263 RepID=A0AAD7D0H2_MYCRO|nr:hypothetical protein B0H17DRAFT_1141302 [Mycena rosella]